MLLLLSLLLLLLLLLLYIVIIIIKSLHGVKIFLFHMEKPEGR